MRKTPLKRIGKIGKANLEARKKIALEGCLGGIYLSPAHRHKRAWYHGSVELLSDYKQWVSACVRCHNQIEHDSILTESVFNKLRGE